ESETILRLAVSRRAGRGLCSRRRELCAEPTRESRGRRPDRDEPAQIGQHPRISRPAVRRRGASDRPRRFALAHSGRRERAAGAEVSQLPGGDPRTQSAGEKSRRAAARRQDFYSAARGRRGRDGARVGPAKARRHRQLPGQSRRSPLPDPARAVEARRRAQSRAVLRAGQGSESRAQRLGHAARRRNDPPARARSGDSVRRDRERCAGKAARRYRSEPGAQAGACNQAGAGTGRAPGAARAGAGKHGALCQGRRSDGQRNSPERRRSGAAQRGKYPLRQKLVLDPDGKIPASLKSKLSDPRAGAQILPMANGVSIQEAVGQLFARLGYQPLPADRPIEIQEEGVAVEARGNWMALAPAVNNKTQDVLVINLTEESGELPDYLKAELAKRGLLLREVALRPGADEPPAAAREAARSGTAPVKSWPREKPEIVDALLLAYGITFGVAENLSVELADGLRVDSRVDRIFESGGQRCALFFRTLAPEIRKSLEEKQRIKTIEL